MRSLSGVLFVVGVLLLIASLAAIPMPIAQAPEMRSECTIPYCPGAYNVLMSTVVVISQSVSCTGQNRAITIYRGSTVQFQMSYSLNGIYPGTAKGWLSMSYPDGSGAGYALRSIWAFPSGFIYGTANTISPGPIGFLTPGVYNFYSFSYASYDWPPVFGFYAYCPQYVATITVTWAVVTIGIVGVLFGILQFLAARRGGSLRENLGAGGWVIALEIVFAARMFSGIIVNVMMTPYNVPVDWNPILIEGPVLGILGVAAFVMACRGVGRNLPVHPASASQKG